MARVIRLQGADCFYHILSRGDGRRDIYKSDQDREKFLNYLDKAREKYGFYLHAYCLMSNHYHLLLETTQPNLSRIMQYINTSYTVYYNIKRKKHGHVFQGRYKSILVEKDSYYGELTRYIHLNPVRGKLTEKPEAYRWSSYREYIGTRAGGPVDVSRVGEVLGMDGKAYREYVEAEREGSERDVLKGVYAGFLLGGEDFIKEKLQELGEELESKEFSYKRKLLQRIEPEEVIAAVSGYYQQSESVVRYGKSRPQRAKQVAIYLLRKRTGLTNREIGAYFRMKAGAVSIAGRTIERLLAEDKTLRKAVDKIDLIFEG